MNRQQIFDALIYCLQICVIVRPIGGKNMRILITNDDGIYAKGMDKIIDIMSKIGDVTVVAPDGERSAISHGITVHTPIVVKEYKGFDHVKAWMTSGTPADCVRIAMEDLLDEKPDLIVSGINNGPNLGLDVVYSGTVAGAMEGYFYNVPSIAFSLLGDDYTVCEQYIPQIVDKVLNDKNNPQAMHNVNFPPFELDRINGIKYMKLANSSHYRNDYEKIVSPRGEVYYFLEGNMITDVEENTDIEALYQGYVTITPLLRNYKVDESRLDA